MCHSEKRLIDANALFKAIKSDKIAWRFGVPNTLKLMFDYLRIIINEQPTVDAVEVKHGRWIVDESGVIICSECGAEHEWQDYRASFCEDCGAKMDGDGNV